MRDASEEKCGMHVRWCIYVGMNHKIMKSVFFEDHAEEAIRKSRDRHKNQDNFHK